MNSDLLWVQKAKKGTLEAVPLELSPTKSYGATVNAGTAQPPAAAAAARKPVDPRRGCLPDGQSGAAALFARGAPAGAAAGGKQNPAPPARGSAAPAAAAAAADLTRRGSNAAAGPSGAPPKQFGNLRVWILAIVV